MVLTKAEVRRWRKDDVTVYMFDRIVNKIDDLDQDVHRYLLEGNRDWAVIPNAEMQSLKEVLEIVDDILEDAEGE